MAFGRIPLDYDTMKKSYRYTGTESMGLMDGSSEGREIYNWLKRQRALEVEKNGKATSTSCCMQVSASFNATPFRIPEQGTSWRPNTKGEITGNYYVLTVNELRAWLTYCFGPTEQIKTRSEIPIAPGIVVFDDKHVELWDTSEVLQAPPMMSANFLWGQPRMWYWYIGVESPAPATTVEDWLVGWWKVYDGQDYYYYFSKGGDVKWIDVPPNPKWVPPMHVGNVGWVSVPGETGEIAVIWKAIGNLEPTVENFTRDFGRISANIGMNGTSNQYAPLYAVKLT